MQRPIYGSCTFGPVVVLEDHYLVLGDNPANSFDSRTWGFLPKANVIAKVPLERIGD